MRLLLIIGLFVLPSVGMAQSDGCRQHREGKFLLSDSQGGEWIIERKGKRQIEYSDFYNVKLRFRVRWIDDSTYELQLRKVLHNPDGHDFPKGLKLTATMSKCSAKGYTRKAVGHPSGATLESRVRRLAE